MMTVRQSILILLAMCALFVSSSCEHRELSDVNNMHYVRVYLDEDIKNVTTGIYNEAYDRPTYTRPVVLRAVLASPINGEVKYESMLRNHGNDERGYYIDGHIAAIEGQYDLLIYQMGSAKTLLKYPDDLSRIEAYTNPVPNRVLNYLPILTAEFGPDNIRTEPEHILCTKCERVDVPLTVSIDTLKTHEGKHFTASSIAKSYFLQLDIQGVEWVSTAAAVLSGMHGSVKLTDGNPDESDTPVSLFFGMKYADRITLSADEPSTAILYVTFTTFGKAEEVPSILSLNFEFTKTDGSAQVEEIDLTDKFNTSLALENQWILLDRKIVIKPIDSGGGMTPGVENWKDIEADIYM